MSIRQRHKRFVIAVVGRRYEKSWIEWGPHTLKEVQKAMRNKCWKRWFNAAEARVFELVEIKK